MPPKTRYEEIVEAAIEAAEKAGGSQLDFCRGLRTIFVTVKERLEMEVSDLPPDEVATLEAEGIG